MIKKGLSKRQLAINSGLPPTTVTSAFAKRSEMTIETVAAFAKALGVTPEYLLGIAADEAEQDLIATYRQMNEVDKARLMGIAQVLLSDYT